MRKPKVLVMDEATASVDLTTDARIQRTVRSAALEDCTVLVVVHRLHTIMDAGQIMVLRQGKLAEYGPPQILLEGGGSGIFKDMVDSSDNADTLRRIAVRSVESWPWEVSAHDIIEPTASGVGSGGEGSAGP